MGGSSWLLERLSSFERQTALVWNGQQTSYAELLASIGSWDQELAAHNLSAGACVAFQGDYSPGTCALLMALISKGIIAVPLASTVRAQREEFLQIAEANALFEFE